MLKGRGVKRFHRSSELRSSGGQVMVTSAIKPAPHHVVAAVVPVEDIKESVLRLVGLHQGRMNGRYSARRSRKNSRPSLRVIFPPVGGNGSRMEDQPESAAGPKVVFYGSMAEYIEKRKAAMSSS